MTSRRISARTRPAPRPPFLWAFLWAYFGAAPSPVFADTEVCGTLSLATEWTAAESPYLVTGDIFIPLTSRLRIGPGVTVRFGKPRPCPSDTAHLPQADWSDSAYTGLKIDGTFFCIGTEDKPVVFEPAPAGTPPGSKAPGKSETASRPPRLIGWDGIRLSGQNANQAEIAFSVFRGANQAITAEKSGFYIHHCLFEGNNTGLYLGLRGDVAVINCAFLDNLSAGLVMRKAGPRVTGTLFSGNHSYGIWGDGRNLARIAYNDFWNSGEEHCYRCPYPVLVAEAKAAAKRPAPEGAEAEAKPAEARSSKTKPAHPDAAAADPLGNLAVDPLFMDSPGYRAARDADLRTPTPAHLVRDPKLAKLEAESRPRSPSSFRPQGKGPCLLSEYSRLIDAGPPGSDFHDRDGTRNDIGLHGGTQGRITRDPF